MVDQHWLQGGTNLLHQFLLILADFHYFDQIQQKLLHLDFSEIFHSRVQQAVEGAFLNSTNSIFGMVSSSKGSNDRGEEQSSYLWVLVNIADEKSSENWSRQDMEPEARGIGVGSGDRQVAGQAREDEHGCTHDGQTGKDCFTEY